MFPGMMGAPPQEVGENQWAQMPLYQRVNHLAGTAMDVLDGHIATWPWMVVAMMFLHKDYDPMGWIPSRIRLVVQMLQAAIPIPSIMTH